MAEKVKSKSASTAKVKLPTVKELLEAGVQFGHETKRWDPRFAEFVYTKRDKFHIIDLEKTLEKFEEALRFLHDVAKKGGEIMFIGTKRQARDILKDEAVRCGAHFVVNRWVGGTLTNFERVDKSIKKLVKLEEDLSGDISKYSQFQLSNLRREWARLDRLFGGVKQMEKLPEAVVIIDAKYEKLAIRELKKSGLPIVSIVDSNTDPRGIDYPIPGNDDAIKSLELLIGYIADAISKGYKGKGIKHEFIDLSMVGIKEEDVAEKVEGKGTENQSSREPEKPIKGKGEIKRKEEKTKRKPKAKKKKSTEKKKTKTVKKVSKRKKTKKATKSKKTGTKKAKSKKKSKAKSKSKKTTKTSKK
jgi:small subunit ribosomal protein S2